MVVVDSMSILPSLLVVVEPGPGSRTPLSGGWLRVFLLEGQQALLEAYATCIPLERAVGAHHPVAGDHQQDGVGGARAPHFYRLPRPPDRPGHLAVGARLAERDARKLLPDGLL